MTTVSLLIALATVARPALRHTLRTRSVLTCHHHFNPISSPLWCLPQVIRERAATTV